MEFDPNSVLTVLAQMGRNISQVLSEALDWVVVFGERIVEKPVLFLFVVAVPLVGLGVGLLNRVIRSN